ncbi:thymidine kinase [Martelella mediterranea]|uniref:Thymidine kinase n=1 Tax=Martelella mediterranea TaxID=293089 RepID=A0A4R3NDZ7_9HYPH|nr:thymidine kinase [Martelella mediterranea]TCT27572.1 thymidine kinase [Martelella mediterranea]
MAKLHFNYATMNAGKSTLLLQAAYNYRERGMHVVILLAELDDRAGRGVVSSRIGLTSEAVTFGPETDLFALAEKLHAEAAIDCLFIDEAHFATGEHIWQLARVVDELEIPVMAHGLRSDFRGQLFPASTELFILADEVREVRTICHCGRKATMVARLDESGNALLDGPQIEVGGNERYVSYCRKHWKEKIGKR